MDPSLKIEESPAIILCGGFGTRLRPLTCLTPKPFLPLLNQPILVRQIRNLERDGVEKIILATGIGMERLKYDLEKMDFEAEIIYSEEKRPLGTGGAVRNALKHVEGHERFFVLNADIVSEISYRGLIESHLKSMPLATITFKLLEDVTGFGVAEMERERVLRFVEKPRPEETPSHYINAGIYVLENEIMDMMADDRSISIEREIFPIIAERGEMRAYIYEGLWFDIGDMNKYLEANWGFLEEYWRRGEIRSPANAQINFGVKIQPPTMIGEGTKVEKDAVLGPMAIVGENATIRGLVEIQGSVIMKDVLVDGEAKIVDSVVARGSSIGRGVVIERGTAVGEWVEIDDDLTIGEGAKICPGKHVTRPVEKGEIVL